MHVPTESKDDNADRAVPDDGDTMHQSLTLIEAIASEQQVPQPSDQIAQAPQHGAFQGESINHHFHWEEMAET